MESQSFFPSADLPWSVFYFSFSDRPDFIERIRTNLFKSFNVNFKSCSHTNRSDRNYVEYSQKKYMKYVEMFSSNKKLFFVSNHGYVHSYLKESTIPRFVSIGWKNQHLSAQLTMLKFTKFLIADLFNQHGYPDIIFFLGM